MEWKEEEEREGGREGGLTDCFKGTSKVHPGLLERRGGGWLVDFWPVFFLNIAFYLTGPGQDQHMELTWFSCIQNVASQPDICHAKLVTFLT